jgi:glyceraldehyde-3-phosphate dehydrogenase/erythrose-4-phosphate dehydrogenase
MKPVGGGATPVQPARFTFVFDAKAGIQRNPTFVKLIAWYDNEWGYRASSSTSRSR